MWTPWGQRAYAADSIWHNPNLSNLHPHRICNFCTLSSSSSRCMLVYHYLPYSLTLLSCLLASCTSLSPYKESCNQWSSNRKTPTWRNKFLKITIMLSMLASVFEGHGWNYWPTVIWKTIPCSEAKLKGIVRFLRSSKAYNFNLTQTRFTRGTQHMQNDTRGRVMFVGIVNIMDTFLSIRWQESSDEVSNT